jgi:alpha-mannosidase
VPHQVLTLNGSPHLRILASNVPPAGYKVFEILSGQGTAPTNEAAIIRGDDNSIVENDVLRLVLERDGAIRSFTDKQRGNTELAAVHGGLKLNDFAADSDEGEPLRVEHRGPVSVTLLARSQAGLPHTTAITLYRGSDRVDIRNELHANFGDVRHWAFSFALNQPSVRTEEVGAVILNQLQSAGGEYADTHARYDYLTVNHFADITDGSGTKGMTVSNPDLAFARLGRSTATHLDTTTPQLHLLAGGQVDGPNLGIRGQNGNTHFLQRFALRPHGGYHPTGAMKFALEHQNPLVTGAIIGSSSNAYPEATHSLLKVSNPDVLLWALKPHEDGIERGLVVRLWNLSDQPAEADITFPGGISVAHRLTHIETDVEPVPLTAAGTLPVTFTRQQIQTYRFKPR